ncbi:hypothetical protein AAMO2058_000621400 [Amorphochlora amoebiformis]
MGPETLLRMRWFLLLGLVLPAALFMFWEAWSGHDISMNFSCTSCRRISMAHINTRLPRLKHVPHSRSGSCRTRVDLVGNGGGNVEETRQQILAGAGALAIAIGAFRAFQASQTEKESYDRITMDATPVFTVTQKTGEFPYFTQVFEDGTRHGYFFTEKTDAERVLKDVRSNMDPEAIIASFPLDKVLEIVRKPDWQTGGEFFLKSSDAQLENADEYLKASGKPLFNRSSKIAVPVFYDERLISVMNNEDPTLMGFLRLEDMKKTWDTRMSETRVVKKGFGKKKVKQMEKSIENDKSLVTLAMATEKDVRPLDPKIMDLTEYIDTVQNNEAGAKAIIISSEQFIRLGRT